MRQRLMSTIAKFSQPVLSAHDCQESMSQHACAAMAKNRFVVKNIHFK
jgi:hypothetical protein